MEGMICRGLRGLQEIYNTVEGSNVTGEQWATGVIIKLLETTLRNGCTGAFRYMTGLAEFKQLSARRSYRWQ